MDQNKSIKTDMENDLTLSTPKNKRMESLQRSLMISGKSNRKTYIFLTNTDKEIPCAIFTQHLNVYCFEPLSSFPLMENAPQGDRRRS